MAFEPPTQWVPCGGLLAPVAGKSGQRRQAGSRVRITYLDLAPVPVVAAIVERDGTKIAGSEKLRPWDFGTGAAVSDFLALRERG